MLCESCHQRDAVVHLTQEFKIEGFATEPESKRKQQLCEECADAYFACTPGMNPSRGLICLSDWYRSKLYDLLEEAHPEAFDNSDTEVCRRGSELMAKFLREHLHKDGIELNDDAFQMLCQDFFGSYNFYARADKVNQTRSDEP